jgi:hypothetical protein
MCSITKKNTKEKCLGENNNLHELCLLRERYIREKDLRRICGKPLCAKSFYGLTQKKGEKNHTSRWVI